MRRMLPALLGLTLLYGYGEDEPALYFREAQQALASRNPAAVEQALDAGAAALRRVGPDYIGYSSTLIGMARMYDDMGEPAKAAALRQEGLSAARKAANREATAGILYDLALIDLRAGRYRPAAASLEEAATLTDSIRLLEVLLGAEATAQEHLGNLTHAESLLKQQAALPHSSYTTPPCAVTDEMIPPFLQFYPDALPHFYARHGRFEEGLRIYQELVQKAEQGSVAQQDLALARLQWFCLMNRHMSEARDILRKRIAILLASPEREHVACGHQLRESLALMDAQSPKN